MIKIAALLSQTFLIYILSLTSAHAQMSATINLYPQFPGPRSVVSLEIESYSFNVNTAMITWTIDNRVVLQGQGETELSVKTGEVGQATNVKVVSQLADGSQIEQSINVTPSSVTLLYESLNSYVPLLYEGRSLASTGGKIRVTALPSISDGGSSVTPSSLSYSWYVDDKYMKEISGRGKQSATIALNYLQDSTRVKVAIFTPRGNTSEKTITVYPHEVMPLLYLHDPILGPNFSSLIDNRFETTSEFTVALEPFYVSSDTVRPATYTWYLDGISSTPLGGRLLSFLPKENSYGSKILTIDVFGSNKILQKGSLRTELIFDTRR